MNSTQSPNYANEIKQLPRIRIFYNRANTQARDINQYFRCFPSANVRNEKWGQRLLKETIDVQVNRSTGMWNVLIRLSLNLSDRKIYPNFYKSRKCISYANTLIIWKRVVLVISRNRTFSQIIMKSLKFFSVFE